MSTALRELQARFVAEVMTGDPSGVLAEVTGDAIPAAARLRVYRHHILESLGRALATTFPTVEALVGAGFFRSMAQAFVAQSPPSQPVLAEYGEGFPAFVAGYPAARDLAYLTDVARLDWALNVAFHAPADDRLAAADLASRPAEELPNLRPALAPGTALLRSSYPLDRIWAASQPGAPADPVDAASGGIDLLVLRRPGDSAFVGLGPGEGAFVAVLADGGTLEEAAVAATASSQAFDLMTSFARLISLGAFAALR